MAPALQGLFGDHSPALDKRASKDSPPPEHGGVLPAGGNVDQVSKISFTGP